MARSHNAVLLATVPDTFKPSRPHDMPASIVSAELYCRNLGGSDSAGFCRVFNKAQLAAGLADRRWALRIAAGRACWRDVRGDNGHGRPAEDLERDDAPAASTSGQAAEDGLAVPDRPASIELTAEHCDGPRNVDAGELLRVFAAAELMTEPRIEGLAAGDWWRALLLTLLETGLRLSEVLTIETAAIDWAAGSSCLAVHALRPGAAPARFSPAAMRALERIHGDRRFLFPCPGGQSQLRRAFARLQDLAGVPADRRFTFHDLRWAALPSLARGQEGRADA